MTYHSTLSDEKPLISIIIPYFNCRRIIACLESIKNQSYGKSETIVVNNNSSGNYLRLLDGYPIRILNEPAQNSYAAGNRGIESAGGEYVVFTDADCVADKDWLNRLYTAAKENMADMVLGEVIKVVSAEEKTSELVDRDIYHDHRLLFSKGKGTTANLMVSKAALKKLEKNFSLNAFSGLDQELIKELVASGAKYIYAPEAVVFHDCRKSSVSLMAKGFRTGVGYSNRMRFDNPRFLRKMIFVKNECLKLFNPLRKDVIEKAGTKSYRYALSFYLHFLAHGIGRIVGLSGVSGSRIFRKFMRYT